MNRSKRPAPGRAERPARLARAVRAARPGPVDPSTWTPRRPSPARTSVVALQLVAFGGVAVALVGTVWWLVTSSAGASLGTLVSALLVVPVSAALLYFGWTGLRHWLAGGPPTRLYGFDALPVIFLLVTAGPGALQDLLGVAITIVFVLPALVTFLASSR